MQFRYKAALVAAAAGIVAAPAAAQQSGPVAVYWVSAATTTGMGGMMGAMGAGAPAPRPKRPGLGAMMGAALGGGLPGFGGGHGAGGGGRGAAPAASHSLTLQLGSTQSAADPQAEHLPPQGLGAGPSLPLVTPRGAPPAPPEPGMPPQMNQRPHGKIMIYWGCGEHAAAPPLIIDFSKIGPGMPVPNLPVIAANPGHPPAPGRSTTYGDWPNDRSRTTVPAEGSLVGEHTVQGNYSPPIHFSLGPDHDFMAPLTITSKEPTPGGGTRITWNPVPGATGYFAWMMGGMGGGRGGDDDVQAVMWSSSATPAFMGAVMDYLPPAEVRRLIAARAVLPPRTSECIIPSEVMQHGGVGMLSMIAYGDEVNFADPPRPANPKAPWNLKWTVKVRYKSTTGAMIGVPGM
jgi:hypothetical protein